MSTHFAELRGEQIAKMTQFIVEYDLDLLSTPDRPQPPVLS